MDKIHLKSPAKINLYLEVTGKRDDGYHNLETVFQAVDLEDKLSLELTKERSIKVVCRHPDVPLDSSNLTYRAANTLFNKLKIKVGLKIGLEKQIPVAAGLGGGSSNAASVILGLNSLLGLNLAKEEMLVMASEIGADVPFFILEENCALGRGRGDKLTVLNNVPDFWYVIVHPNIKISASWAYQNFKLNLTKKKPGVKIFTRSLMDGNVEQIAPLLYNDLENVIGASYSDVDYVKRVLMAKGIKAVLVSGSGPCVFGMVQSKREAEIVKEQFDKHLLEAKTFVCRSR